MDNKKLLIGGIILTTIVGGVLIYNEIQFRRKEDLVNKKITSFEDAIKILNEKTESYPPIDTNDVFDLENVYLFGSEYAAYEE